MRDQISLARSTECSINRLHALVIRKQPDSGSVATMRDFGDPSSVKLGSLTYSPHQIITQYVYLIKGRNSGHEEGALLHVVAFAKNDLAPLRGGEPREKSQGSPSPKETSS